MGQQDNPIIVLDDDDDDLEFIEQACTTLKLPNQFLFFKNGVQLKDYLKASSVAPFFILCDVNLSGTSGFEIRKMLLEDAAIKYKSVPFIFWSNHASEKQIQEAYDLPAQGFFIKSDNFHLLCTTLSKIVAYWSDSQHPKRL